MEAVSLDLQGFMTDSETQIPDMPRTFGAAKAFATFALVFLGQTQAGIHVIAAATVLALGRGENVQDAAFAKTLLSRSMPALILVSALVSAMIVFVIARVWAQPILRDTSDAGVGLVRARLALMICWGCAGALLAATYMMFSQWISTFDPSMPLGPLASAASAGGASRVAWAVMAVLFAPLVEETLFRGLLLAGFSASWGGTAGAVVVTILFAVLHLTETMRYWPATVAVCSLSLATLAARRTSGSLLPAIVLHGAYNAVIVVATFLDADLSL